MFSGFFPTSRENLGTKLGRSFGRFVLGASSETQGQLQSSSKILKHFPNVDLRITMVSVLQNTRGSTLGRERAHYSENKSVRSKNLKNFPEISRERCLFQRFVTSIVVGTILSSRLAAPGSPRGCSNHYELIPATVVICVNPFSHKSDQY